MKQPNGYDVLYIEDEEVLSRGVKRELEGLGYASVDHYKTWDAAQQRLKENSDSYDVAILDVKLEGSALDGIDIGGVIHARHKIPIVIHTSFCDERTMTRLEALPFALYLPKPATAKQLDACIRRVIRLTAKHFAQTITDADKTVAQRLENNRVDAPLIKFDRKYVERFPYKELAYLNYANGSVDIHMIDGKVRPLSTGLAETIRIFNRDDLIRTHKSYAVPYHAVKRVYYSHIELITGVEVPIGDKYRDNVKKL